RPVRNEQRVVVEDVDEAWLIAARRHVGAVGARRSQADERRQRDEVAHVTVEGVLGLLDGPLGGLFGVALAQRRHGRLPAPSIAAEPGPPARGPGLAASGPGGETSGTSSAPRGSPAGALPRLPTGSGCRAGYAR